jgi:hypothetical protein
MQEQPNPFGAPIPDPSGRMTAPIAHSGVNDSGTGGTAVLPAELRGFNWGAFLLNWIWSIRHNTWIGLIAIIPYVGFIMAIVLGFKGNEWAWQNRKWDSVEHFRATQRVWTMWGVGIIVVSLVLGFVLGLLSPVTSGSSR